LPIVRELRARCGEFEHVLIHTGQHYDRAMSDIFLEQLGVGEPDHSLGVGSGPHGEQTARIISALEPLLTDLEPDLLLVPGDVNSTMAAALTAAKLDIPVGHVEAGLRSFDRSMPEEVNRIVTDQLSDLLFIHSPEARDHLMREGRDEAHIHYVGNTMIDSLVAMRSAIAEAAVHERHALEPGGYLVVTLHRPALVDGPMLGAAMTQLATLAEQLEVVFPAHPRTRKNIEQAGLDTAGIRLMEPLGYVEFLSLLATSAGALTDSGGIQEETTFLGIPCFTLRDNTERPITCEVGTNVLLGLDPVRIGEIPELLERAGRKGGAAVPELWDGQASGRIVDLLASLESWSTLRDAPPARAVSTGLPASAASREG
jgi:UDP-N-acetylglucosamine 2-epimerase (non-hydrolysing)